MLGLVFGLTVDTMDKEIVAFSQICRKSGRTFPLGYSQSERDRLEQDKNCKEIKRTKDN